MSRNIVLDPKSPKHSSLLKAVLDRYNFARTEQSKNISAWDNADKASAVYIKETEVDALRRANREQGFVDYTTIQVPYSYAMLLSAHTYWTGVFLSRSPVFQYMGRNGASQQNVMALEALIDYQVQVGEMLVPLYIWLYDMGKYGRGILGLYWDEEFSTIAEIVEEPITLFGMDTGRTKRVKRSRTVRGYSGNRVFNVRPHDFFSDPRVPLTQLQKGEFCGVYKDIDWNTIVKGQAAGLYMNVEFLKQHHDRNYSDREPGAVTTSLPNQFGTITAMEFSKDAVSGIEMYIRLIPKDWDLGTGTQPELWVFTIANKSVIIGARPLGAIHDRFPFFPLEYEIEGYNVSKRSMLEINQPLNDIITWLVNSHFYNVRKGLNDQFIVDPSMVVMSDLTDPQPGKMVRLKPSAYGRDVRSVLTQMPVADLTRSHLADMNIISDIMQRLNGINDAQQGVLAPGGRKTATEVRSSGLAGIGRQKTQSEYNSALGWAPLSQVLVQNTQQYFDQAIELRVVGDIVAGQQFVNVDPELISGFYDFVPVDGTMPVDKFAMAALWKELIGQLRVMPEITQQYDMGKIFSYVAQLAGLRNINQFKVQVVPDAVAQQQAQDGNMIPLGGGNGNAGTTGAIDAGAGSPPGTPIVAGLGPVG